MLRLAPRLKACPEPRRVLSVEDDKHRAAEVEEVDAAERGPELLQLLRRAAVQTQLLAQVVAYVTNNASGGDIQALG